MSDLVGKTVWLEAPGKVVLREEAVASPGAGEILCETIVTAISPGTELAAWRGDPPLRPGVVYPRLQGYCNVAKVLECGAGVEGFAPGDRVLTLQSHRSHFVCPASEAYVKLTYAMGAKDVVTSYLFHLGYNAVLRAGVRAGSKVCVIGLGVLGLTSVAMATQAGAEVFAISNHHSSRYVAEEEYCSRGAYARDDIDKLKQEIDPGADVVILTTNGWDDYHLAMEIAAQNGCIACLGFPGRGMPPGDYNPLASEYFYTKQLRIEAVGMSPLENDPRGFNRFNLRDNLGYIARSIEFGLPDSRALISGIYPALQIERAYTDLDARKDNAITYLLDWSA